MRTIGTFQFGFQSDEDFARYQESLYRQVRLAFRDIDVSLSAREASDLILDTLFNYASTSDVLPEQLPGLLYDAFSQLKDVDA